MPLRLLLAASVIALTTGCFQARYAYDGPKILTTAPSMGTETEVVNHFEVHDRGFYWLMGLIPMGGGANGAQLAAEQVGEHDGVINLRLSDGQDLMDTLLSQTVCLLSLLCGSWSVWAEGDVVNMVGPPAAAWVDSPDAPVETLLTEGTPLPAGADAPEADDEMAIPAPAAVEIVPASLEIR